jgi:bacteriocin biosynthesis cyclodehydratase domain-containing protein
MDSKATPRIKRSCSVLAHTPDCVEVRLGVWNTLSHTVVDASKSGNLWNIVAQLNGSLTLSQIAHHAGVSKRDVEAVVDQLMALGVIEPEPSNFLDYYLDVVSGNGSSIPLRSVSPIVLVGSPDLTKPLHSLMAQSLGSLEIVAHGWDDPICAPLTNRDRSWLLDGIQFERTAAQFEEWQGKLLVFIANVIDPLTCQAINRVCLHHNMSWLHGATDGPFILVGPLVVPQRTACWECFETRVFMNLREAAVYQRYKNALASNHALRNGQGNSAVLASLLVSLTAMEALSFAATADSTTLGSVLSLYLPTMEFSMNEVLRLPGCAACSPLAERDDEELYFDVRVLLGE